MSDGDELPDGHELQLQGNVDAALLSRADLVEAEHPNRPRNTAPTFKFRELVCSLFEAMVNLQHKPQTRRGPQFSAHEARRSIITRFIQRWRHDVGPDIYPAFRLIMPDRDKDRPMYGLKEASLGKMLVAVSSIDISPLLTPSDNGHWQGLRGCLGHHQMEITWSGTLLTTA